MEFEEFFRTETDPLVRMCWLLTLDREVAADIAQETMARAWASWDTISRPGSNPAAWTRTVATNLSRSRWRRLKTATAALPRLHRAHVSAAVSDPQLAEALRLLPSRQREAVVLRYWADLQLADVAVAMDVSVGSVKQHLGRARQRLGEFLDPSQLEEMTL